MKVQSFDFRIFFCRKKFDVSQIFVHPSYQDLKKHDDSNITRFLNIGGVKNDIALLKLTSKVMFKSGVFFHI